MNVDEGAKPSSLISVHKLATRDVHYDLHLLRDLEMANARTRAELGSLPSGGLTVQVKRKPNIPAATRLLGSSSRSTDAGTQLQIDSGTTAPNAPQEADDMRLRTLAMVAAVGAAALGGGEVDAGQHDPTSPDARATSNRRVPREFQRYLSTSVGEDTRCVVGKVTNGDGMNARPYVYLAKGVDERLQWTKLLSMPGDYYEGRATHCVKSGDNLYVLLQLDTQAPRSLSQTLLSIVEIRMHDGATLNEVSVPVPDTRGAYTSWVWDDDGFKRVGDEFLVTGRYRYMDAEDDLPFSTSIKM